MAVTMKEFADVTLACRGDQFHAHKTILTSNSTSNIQYELSKVSTIYLDFKRVNPLRPTQNAEPGFKMKDKNKY